MKNKYYFIFACAMVALLAFGACKKKVVDVNKLCKSFTESVVAEQNGLGNTLTVDTIFLNSTAGDNFSGELRGHVNDSTEVVYDLQVTDEGDELSAEWTLRQ